MGLFKNKKKMEKHKLNILCISDHIDPLVYSTNIKTRFKHIDFIISAGDLPLKYYDFIASSLNKSLFFVFGNHNLMKIGNYKKKFGHTESLFFFQNPTDFTQSIGSTYAGGKVLKHKGVIIAGLDGSMWYNGDIGQYTELGMTFYMMKLIPKLLWNKLIYGRFLDIFLSHAPPFGINDRPDRCHKGFKIFLWFLKVFKPAFHIHGHIHLYNRNAKRLQKFNETEIINAYDHCIIQMEGIL